MRKMVDEETLSWEDRYEKIRKVFQDYSAKDVASSLLCSSLWLPNISSQIKHIYITALFISCQPELFQKVDQISNYEKFAGLMSRILPLLPSFPVEEDYFPETDWGEIKFFFNDNIYKIFYGNEITDIYDYLSMFEIMYAPFDKEFIKKIGRSPNAELTSCLSLQNEILSNIPQSVAEEKLKSISIGNYEVPDNEFWLSVNSFLQSRSLSISD